MLKVIPGSGVSDFSIKKAFAVWQKKVKFVAPLGYTHFYMRIVYDFVIDLVLHLLYLWTCGCAWAAFLTFTLVWSLCGFIVWCLACFRQETLRSSLYLAAYDSRDLPIMATSTSIVYLGFEDEGVTDQNKHLVDSTTNKIGGLPVWVYHICLFFYTTSIAYIQAFMFKFIIYRL